MPPELIFEIGTEEIPAGFLARGLVDLERLAGDALRGARLEFESLRAWGTPRRLALLVTGLADSQPDISERVVGPPARVAFADDGTPTPAAAGFAKKNGVDVSELERGEVEGKKGEYVLCTRKEVGRPTSEVLPPLLSELCARLPWPKSMRWGAGETAFARPVHWIVALHAGELLPVTFAGIDSGRATRGHRFLAPEPIDLDGDVESYVAALRKGFVLVNPEERKNVIRAELSRLEEQHSVRVRGDEPLLDEVTNLVEYPVGICGEFSSDYLEVPEAVVVSAMRAHQRYFSVESDDGALANRFVTIAGTITGDSDVVRRGNERVLAARLDDASFFFQEDQKTPLPTWAARLEGVVFQRKLGSIAKKVERIVQNSEFLAERVGADKSDVTRAAELSKADLVTHMVGEFPDLQGVMGSRYAELGGEPQAVALAIREHYLPRGAGDSLPTSDVGAIVGLADRVDTIVGCFAVGLAPTGSADPYALRRAALAVLAILLDRKWSGLLLDDMVARARESLTGQGIQVTDEHMADVRDFFRVRLRGLLEGRELPADCVDAALAAGYHDVPDAAARAEAVAELRKRADFEPLATAFKRVANILKGAAPDDSPDPDAFVEEDERALWGSFTRIEEAVRGHLSGGDYHRALQVLTELKAPVDKFFETVLVMDKNDRVRQNRLALLGRINATFTRIADFRQLAV